MRFLRNVWLVVWKDLVLEFRTKEILSSMLVFTLVVVVTFNFAFQGERADIRNLSAGILWVAFTFSGVLGLGRSFVSEKDQRCLEGLLISPVGRGSVYLGKVLANFIFMTMLEVIIFPIFAVLFDLDVLHFFHRLMPVFLLGTFGFASVGTILSAMSVNTRTREVMLPVLLFPVMVPILISAVRCTAHILNGGSFAGIGSWVRLLVVFDVIFVVVSLLGFDFVVEE